MCGVCVRECVCVNELGVAMLQKEAGLLPSLSVCEA